MNQANKTIVGMVHLSALPGSPRHQMSLEKIEAAALKDAEALVENGIRQLMVENFGDVPFWQDAVPPIVIASMTRIASRIRDHFSGIPLGINVLRERFLSYIEGITIFLSLRCKRCSEELV